MRRILISKNHFAFMCLRNHHHAIRSNFGLVSLSSPHAKIGQAFCQRGRGHVHLVKPCILQQRACGAKLVRDGVCAQSIATRRCIPPSMFYSGTKRFEASQKWYLQIDDVIPISFPVYRYLRDMGKRTLSTLGNNHPMSYSMG
ncbi:hypothetical protein TWF225_003041 [Orbilia oligospora]|uniref:Uncharacterized protein n=1 Tax=Orbilia oligospora TaxID=2813651 RepID=A0A8H2HLW3_ORBOL|nr:hypothetical protein TWF225_003041 [Orbilia oligospora]KAF3294626.1 hypothetical protein TWF132_003111 [Orbilia oligospora]TGJ66375.1 hypothetical protein EYR41_008016 [Orbilia oligospora]